MPSSSPDHTLVLNVTPGEVLDDRWRIETRVGQGAMGSVYRGRDLRQHRLVAIKILAPEHARKPKVLARFEREAELMTSLRHTNIVHLYGHGRRGVLPYIAMEYLEGMTLGDIVARQGGTLGASETVAIVKEIAAGLTFLHRHELVHRDVKPQNIFVVSGGRVAILDLGVVRDQQNPGLTKPGAMVGTPYYMSPEQIQGLDDIDLRTDVYALAAMSFELLTGRPPFLGSNNFEVLYGHRNTPVPDASTLGLPISKPVATVLSNGMSKQRERRYQSVVDFVEDLEAAAKAKPIDLAKAFSFLDKKLVTPPKPKARLEMRPPEVEIPMADSEDVVSVVSQVARVGRQTEADPEEEELSEPAVTLAALNGPVNQADEPTYIGEVPLERKRLQPNLGTLRLHITDDNGTQINATVLIDGQSRGSASKPVSVTAGGHHLRIEAPGYRSFERHIEVIGGGSLSLTAALEPKTLSPK